MDQAVVGEQDNLKRRMDERKGGMGEHEWYYRDAIAIHVFRLLIF